MKKILKLIAIILVIVALLMLLSIVVNYMSGGSSPFGSLFAKHTFLGKLSMAGALALAIGTLVIAIAISPRGAKKALNRVTSSVRIAGEQTAKFATGLIGGVFAGAGKGILSSGIFWWILGGVAVWALWPDSEDRIARANARAAELANERLALENAKFGKEQMTNQPSGG